VGIEPTVVDLALAVVGEFFLDSQAIRFAKASDDDRRSR
jgi:hypothetical protein